MNATHKNRSILIVSEDWFARSLLVQAARETRLFSSVFAVDDGYSALAAVWQCVIDGWRPDAVLIDRHTPAPTAGGLVATLRTDPDTRRIAVAVLAPADDCPEPARPDTRVDIFSTCDAASVELPWVYQAIAAKLDALEATPVFSFTHPRTAARQHSRLWRPAR